MKLKRFFLLSLLLLFAAAALLAGFVYRIYQGAYGHIYTKEEILAYKNAYATEIYTADGKLLGLVYKVHRMHSDSQELPEHLIKALVAAEDQRYYEHAGIDMRSLLRVGLKNIILGDRSAGGGSTLSQQLAKNMFGRSSSGKKELFIAKVKEMITASRMESLLSKDELITMYLNTVPFGEDIYGIESASMRFFSKPASDLNINESATLVGMLKANNRYNPRLNPENSKERRNTVLMTMVRSGDLTQAEADSLGKLEIVLNYTKLKANVQGYVQSYVEQECRKILSDHNKANGTNYALETDGLIIETTIVDPLQNIASYQMNKHLNKMQKALKAQYSAYNKQSLVKRYLGRKPRKEEKFSALYDEVVSLHGGFMIMDSKSGAIYAYVGGKDFNKYPFDQIQSKRTMASTFKPFLYASALEQGLTPCDLLDNSQLTLNDYDGWHPENYDNTDGGSYTLASALAHSLNIPSVRLFIEQDYDSLERHWNSYRIDSKLKNKPSSALGTTDGSVFELSRAYSAFANGGRAVEPFMVKKISTRDGKVLYSRYGKGSFEACTKEIADQMSAMLQLTVEEGTAKDLHEIYGFKSAFAAKTGTSQSYSDAWIMGYNQDLVFGVRVGANNPGIHFNSGVYGSSVKLALPILGGTLNQMQRYGLMRSKLNAGFDIDSNYLDCDHFKKDGFFKNALLQFRSKGSTVEKESKRINRKRKFNDLIDKINPFKKD